jgi:hypothetical protein
LFGELVHSEPALHSKNANSSPDLACQFAIS